jgi:hypothetical protein
MSTPRRRVLRPARPTVPDPQREQQLRRRCEQLAKERGSLDRWMARLKRAFHAVERQQARVSRIERQLRTLEHP